MANVFISYRRADSASISGRIYDWLVAKFGRKNVFKDVDDIPAGIDFGVYIQASLRQCKVLLVIIGPQWINARDASGGGRLDTSNDWVRLEIETAFSLGLTVIPLLVEEAQMVSADDLPKSLQRLVRINALRVRNDPDFARDMDHVLTAVEQALSRRLSLGIFRRSTPSRSAETQVVPTPSEHLAPKDRHTTSADHKGRHSRLLADVFDPPLRVQDIVTNNKTSASPGDPPEPILPDVPLQASGQPLPPLSRLKLT